MRTEIRDQLGLDFSGFAFSHCLDLYVVSTPGGSGALGSPPFAPEHSADELNWMGKA
ncbi:MULTISPECIES: hypothetical protein [Rhodococcus erythropolis group]|uniref:hypothetical protein n=1 Tax=Rhodococcus erythropolis group TaxID=2840174 RepID=UPI001BE77C1B|nr:MULTISPECIES: hypothetical protein [Rhodococcus erythropolis group]MBT2266092.1 hypothetical protein [Rhodococcus erythropolis]MBT2274269.1 hypothetical protein [Rhodococcus qingshengii]